jgi:hypothetical protein
VREVLRVDSRWVVWVRRADVDFALAERPLQRDLNGGRVSGLGDGEQNLDLADARIEQALRSAIDGLVTGDDCAIFARHEGRGRRAESAGDRASPGRRGIASEERREVKIRGRGVDKGLQLRLAARRGGVIVVVVSVGGRGVGRKGQLSALSAG